MGDEWRNASEGLTENAKRRLSRLAQRQFGRVSRRQLELLGVSNGTIHNWTATSYLHRRLPGVYAVGHAGSSVEAELAEAVLYAGPGAMLSHVTAVWWLGLLDRPPHTHHLSTPRRCNSLPGVIVHGRRELERIWHRELPATTVSQALLDFALTAAPDRLRFALANADYRGLLDLAAVPIEGRRGAGRLRDALQRHQPRLARTRSELERAFVALCERHAIPLPELNVHVEGWLVDALWSDQRLVVELDGLRAHRTPAQLERDHERDLKLRAAGFVVLRYTWRQVTEHPGAVAAELETALSSAGPWDVRGSR